MKTSKISFTIEYAGLHLQVLKNEKGEDVTPLKPVSDLFGLSWEDQRKKVANGPHLAQFLGVCTGAIPGAGGQVREQTCILLTRVAAYLMTVNPDKVRSAGNVGGAEFLEAKLNEWADALHDYEQLGAAFNLQHARAQEAASKACMRLAQLVGIRNKTEAPKDRAVISQIMARMATDLGISYQPDLLDGPA